MGFGEVRHQGPVVDAVLPIVKVGHAVEGAEDAERFPGGVGGSRVAGRGEGHAGAAGILAPFKSASPVGPRQEESSAEVESQQSPHTGFAVDGVQAPGQFQDHQGRVGLLDRIQPARAEQPGPCVTIVERNPSLGDGPPGEDLMFAEQFHERPDVHGLQEPEIGEGGEPPADGFEFEEG
jgi:hypothetical protein